MLSWIPGKPVGSESIIVFSRKLIFSRGFQIAYKHTSCKSCPYGTPTGSRLQRVSSQLLADRRTGEEKHGKKGFKENILNCSNLLGCLETLGAETCMGLHSTVRTALDVARFFGGGNSFYFVVLPEGFLQVRGAQFLPPLVVRSGRGSSSLGSL